MCCCFFPKRRPALHVRSFRNVLIERIFFTAMNQDYNNMTVNQILANVECSLEKLFNIVFFENHQHNIFFTGATGQKLGDHFSMGIHCKVDPHFWAICSDIHRFSLKKWDIDFFFESFAWISFSLIAYGILNDIQARSYGKSKKKKQKQ